MKANTSFGALCLVAAAQLLAGCASVLSKERSNVRIDSVPSGASVHVNGSPRGTTPFDYVYSQEDGEQVSVELRHSGYRNAAFTLDVMQNSGVLFVDAMLLHIPYLVDRNAPEMNRMPVSEHTVEMYREVPEGQMHYLIPVVAMDLELGERPDLGKCSGKPIKMDKEGLFRDLGYESGLGSNVVTALRESWMDARSVQLGNSKADEMVQRAKLYLKPVLRSVRGSLTELQDRYNGPLEVEMEWRFFSGLHKDSLLFAVPMRTTYQCLGVHRSELISGAVQHAARRLADDPDLPARIAAIYDSGVQASKGATVEIKRPKPIAFNGRKEMLGALVKAVVTVLTDDGHGSGFLVSADGYLITNEHVVGDQALVKVKFEGGITLDAQVLKANRDMDLALLKVQAADLPALMIGNDKELKLGEELFAIGTPVDISLGQSVSRGILSGTREIEGRSYLQTDVSINRGNSGGPLIDETGAVVGVTTLKISGRGLEGLGFGVPISVALEMLNITFVP